MDVGVVLGRSLCTSPGELAGFAQEAERRGYESLWVTEHIAIPVEFKSRYPYSPDGRPTWNHEAEWTEAMVTLGFLAAVTRTARLGTSVIPLTCRDPLSLAKQAATVDVLSQGRLELGIGAGWLLEEAEVLGHPTDHRAARLEETVEILRRAWRERSFSFEGEHYRLPEVGVHPQPVQRDQVPIWIGGTSPAALRASARLAAGNLLWLAEPDEARRFAGSLRALNPKARLAVSMRVDFGQPGVLEKARGLAEAGANRLLLVCAGTAEAAVQDLDRFAEVVRPALG